MSKRKIVLLASALCMVAILAIGGTLAYFTDTDSETNTFTVGGVKIDLIEQQVNKDGTALEAFKQDQVLMPIVGSAQGEKDKYGQPVAANYIDKMVTIKNTGTSAAWVRAYFAIPSALDDGFEESFNASMNILHFNFGNANGTSTYNNQWLWGSVAKPNHSGWNYFETIIGDVSYNVYFADYYQPLAAGATTEQFISGVYLDANVDMNKDGEYTITRKGVTTVIKGLNGTVECPVKAVAVQADGFTNAADAVNAAFGADFNPFK